MSRKIDTDANINSIRFVQQTSHPASPASGYEQLYIISGSAHGGLYVKDSAGKQIGPFLTGTSASTGMTFIEEIQPSGVPTGTFSSIPQTYNALKIVYSVRGSSAATYTNWVLRINQDYTDANYRRTFDFGFASSTTGAEGAADAVIGVINANNSPSNSFSMGEITIPFYASTQFNKEAHLIGSHRRDTNSVYMLTLNSSHEWFSTAAVTRIDLVVPAGNYSAGSILRLYGIY